MPKFKGLSALFSPTPGFSRNNPRDPRRPEVRLAPVHLRPSRRLWIAQCAVHGLMAFSLLAALLPHLGPRPLWWLLLLPVWAALLVSLWLCRRQGLAMAGRLSCDQHGWHWQSCGIETLLEPLGQPVVWPWLVVLRFRDTSTGKARNFTLLRDSAGADDLRRLRQWLLTTY